MFFQPRGDLGEEVIGAVGVRTVEPPILRAFRNQDGAPLTSVRVMDGVAGCPAVAPRCEARVELLHTAVVLVDAIQEPRTVPGPVLARVYVERWT